MKFKRLFCILIPVLLSIQLPLWGTLFLNDSFVSMPAVEQIPGNTDGEYRDNNGLTHANNQAVSGGTIIGFSPDFPWGGNSGNPRVVPLGLESPSLDGMGGSVEFRGATNPNLDRYVYRRINSYTGGSSLYFTGTLSTNLIDDDAVSLIAFTNPSANDGDRSVIILANDGGFYRGLAFGFKGDGNGGMDLIVRYRTGSLDYVDEILLTGISVGTAYTVVGRIDWNDPESLGGTRDPFTIWVNPAGGSEPVEGDFEAVGFLGDESDLTVVHFLQKNLGSSLDDAVYMDEIRLASSWESLFEIEETGISYADWSQTAFPEGTSESDRLPEADPNGNGISNFLAYALRLDPMDGTRAGLPQAGFVEDEEGSFLQFQFRRHLGAQVAYAVQTSDDLVDWDLASGNPVVIDADPDGDGGAELVEITLPVANEEGRLFARLLVTGNE